MQATVRLSNTLTITIEGSSQKELFENLASLQEVFSQHTCGKCNKQNVVFQVREVDSNKFYEMRCRSCGAVLSFGAHKKGDTLFPKRKDSDGNLIGVFGWAKWNPTTQTRE